MPRARQNHPPQLTGVAECLRCGPKPAIAFAVQPTNVNGLRKLCRECTRDDNAARQRVKVARRLERVRPRGAGGYYLIANDLD